MGEYVDREKLLDDLSAAAEHGGMGEIIIRGVNGEFYPCKADIFKKTYEAVE